ncbi:MAG: sigma-54-dependent Fis family transcriptional regulator [Nitrospirae bacterium]|nr:sigma-54-dependent Fis family transcriptional regulator [Candidatus Troglogloeales bacterium]
MNASAKPILVVDDDPAMRVALTESLKLMGYATQTAISGEDALARINEKPVAAILTDMKMSGMSGIDLFHNVNKRNPKIPVIIMSAHGTIDTAVSAMKLGVLDYLVKPFSQERLSEVIKKSSSPAAPLLIPRDSERRSSASQKLNDRVILTKDPGMLKLLKMAEVVASSDATIFIEGESGTGKELLARFVHEHSPRAHRPFIAINCAAVPENLLESELFGYEKGAFTGAITRKPGKFELAHTGTILLDEVSEMHIALQAKLLRVLQEKEVDSVGGREPISLDIRVIATTNRPILKEVTAGRFREDLYYRLNVFPLHIPPLRDRIADIPILAEYFVKKVADRNNREAQMISHAALSSLMARGWRGNVREMENIMERATLIAQNEVILPEHLDVTGGVTASVGARHAVPLQGENSEDSITDTTTSNGYEDRGTTTGLPSKSIPSGCTLWEVERNLILGTLAKMDGNRTHAAKSLGISIRTLRNKLKEYRSEIIPEAVDEEACNVY